jgi:DNA-binding transcriptional LysR family regulator
LKLEYFESFIESVEAGSISKASERLHISQPALTRQLHCLEDMFGAKLLVRTSRGVTVTPVGKLIYDHAQSIMTEYTNMLDGVMNIQNKDQIIRIASTHTVYSYALPCALYQIKKNFPTYKLHIEARHEEDIEERVINGSADIGFVTGPPVRKGLVAKEAFSDMFLLVATKDVCSSERIKLNQLYRQPLIMLSRQHRSGEILNRYLIDSGIDTSRLQVLYELDSVESLKLSAVNGYGLSFLPYMSIKKELYNKQLHKVEVDGLDISCSYYTVSKRTPCDGDKGRLKLISYLERTLRETVC